MKIIKILLENEFSLLFFSLNELQKKIQEYTKIEIDNQFLVLNNQPFSSIVSKDMPICNYSFQMDDKTPLLVFSLAANMDSLATIKAFDYSKILLLTYFKRINYFVLII